MEVPAVWSAQTGLSSCDQVYECTCSFAMVSRYQKRISGPLLDRIDIHIEVPRVEYEKLSDDRLGEPLMF
jgi:magnesium chelatase family protein